MKTILIGGYYGAGNIGDDAILAAIISSLAKYKQDLQFVVASFNPELTRQKFQVESVHWRKVVELAKYVERSDLVIVGGGGLFQDYWGVDRQTYLRNIHGGITTYGTLVKLAQLFKKPCMLYAVGVGPLSSVEARQETRDIFQICTTATVRDGSSLQILKETGLDVNDSAISVLADPVFCFEPGESDLDKAVELINSLHVDANVPLIGISLRYWEHGILYDEWTSLLADQLDEFVQQTGVQLIFTPFQNDPEGKFTNDTAVNRLVVSKMKRADRVFVIQEVQSPGTVQAIYSHCALVIGMRLHSIILSLNAGTPAAAISYDPKVQALMENLNLSQFSLPIVSIRDFWNNLNLLWEWRMEIKSRIAQFIPEQKALAAQNAQIALALLDDVPANNGGRGAIKFAFERLEQMEFMDMELREEKERVLSLRRDFQTLNAENIELRTRINEMENSRGWKLLEASRKIRRSVSSVFKRG